MVEEQPDNAGLDVDSKDGGLGGGLVEETNI